VELIDRLDLQCHCYVCDSLAPCSLWGEGNSPNDHCHASEEPGWKSLRMIAKYGSFTSLAGAAGKLMLVEDITPVEDLVRLSEVGLLRCDDLC